MTGYKRLEKAVNTFVGTPTAWTLYGLWQAAKCACRGAVWLYGWARSRYADIRCKHAARRSPAA
jgi:hypothetical protein